MEGTHAVVLVAIKDIDPGEEILVKYCEEGYFEKDGEKTCLCTSCTGRRTDILVPPRPPNHTSSSSSVPTASTSRQSATHNNEDGGQSNGATQRKRKHPASDQDEEQLVDAPKRKRRRRGGAAWRGRSKDASKNVDESCPGPNMATRLDDAA